MNQTKLDVLCLLLLIFLTVETQSAKILGLFGTASRSHHIWISALTNELAKRGHQITYFSPDKDDKPQPNVRQVWVEDIYSKMYTEMSIEALVEEQGVLAFINGFDDYGRLCCKYTLDSNGFREISDIVRKEKFDLIIVDYTMGECMFPLADDMQDVPVVGVSPYGGTVSANYLSGTPEALAIKPNTYLPLLANMTFLQRAENVLVHTVVMLDRFYRYLPALEEMAKTKYPNMKSIHSLLDRLSIILTNNHYAFDPPTPSSPALINVGGLHIRPPKPLPKDIQAFLDESKHGAIFFSLGSNVQSSKLSPEIRKTLIETFKELAPIRILWKFETDLPEKPNNVMIAKWLPQSDILAHPNVKLFFSHSGLLSSQEALYHGKPVLGMPFLVDQFINIDRLVREGLAERMDYLTLTKRELLEAIKKIFNNPSYREKAQRISTVFRDQPETPLERAVFWTEYVLRHKGAPALRSAALDLSWYQNMLLDVILLFTAVAVIALLLLHWTVKAIFKLIFGGAKPKKLKQR